MNGYQEMKMATSCATQVKTKAVLCCTILDYCSNSGCVSNTDCNSESQCDPKTCTCQPKKCTLTRNHPGGLIKGPDDFYVGQVGRMMCFEGFIIFDDDGRASRSSSVKCMASNPVPIIVSTGKSTLNQCVKGEIVRKSNFRQFASHLFLRLHQ